MAYVMKGNPKDNGTIVGTQKHKEKTKKSAISKLHEGFAKASDEGTEKVKKSKTLVEGFTQALGSLPAHVGEITTRYITKGVDAIKNIKKKKKK